MNKPSKNHAPLRPFDESMITDLSMYDHMPYIRDSGICNIETVRLVSGNIIKYYRYDTNLPFNLDNQDEMIRKKLDELRKLRAQELQEVISDVEFGNKLTEEQVKRLVEDEAEIE